MDRADILWTTPRVSLGVKRSRVRIPPARLKTAVLPALQRAVGALHDEASPRCARARRGGPLGTFPPRGSSSAPVIPTIILSRFWREGSERCRGAGFSPGSPRRPPRRRRLDASSPPRGVRIASPPNLQSSSRSRPTASCMLLPASRRYGNPPISRDGLLAPRTWWTRWKDGLRTLPTSRMLGPRSCSSAAARCAQPDPSLSPAAPVRHVRPYVTSAMLLTQ